MEGFLVRNAGKAGSIMGTRKHDITDIYGVRGRKRFADRAPDAPESGFRHSDAYHKHFRGYTEIRRVDENGRIAAERYYTRPWIVSGLTSRNYWLSRLLYACLALGAGALYIWALCQDIPATRSMIVAVPGLPAVILLFLQAVVTVSYIAAPRRMTLWDYASTSGRLRKVSAITACVQALAAFALAGCGLFDGNQVKKSLLCAGAVLISAVLSGGISMMERKMPYSEVRNDTKLPKGEAYEIW